MLNSGITLLSPKHCFLSTFLLYEKTKKFSFWKEYLDVLPSSYENFPIFFGDKELYYLKGSPFLSKLNIIIMIIEQIIEKKDDIKKDYNTIIEISKEFGEFSLKEFSEMRMAVSSRIFGIKVQGKKTDCFCPLADMLNHRRPRQTQWYFSDDLNSFIIQAVNDINVEDEIFDSYGKKCNSRFLLNYGFIVEKNDSNEFPYTVELNSSHKHYDFKFQLLNSKTTEKTFRLQTNYEEATVQEFFSFLRFINFEGGIDVLIDVS